MNHAHRPAIFAFTACACLVAVAAPLCSGLAVIPAAPAPWLALAYALAGAVLALGLTGFVFQALLARRLGALDAAAALRQQLADERRGREDAERALGDTHDALCRLVRQQEQVRETERQRIARDIHDDLGQHLLALKIEVQLASHGASPAVDPALARLASGVDHGIVALRTVIDDLRPQALDGGLQVAIEHHLREFSRLSGISCQLLGGSDAAVSELDRDIDVVLLRILRESLANVVRHAQASAVWVGVKRGAREVTLEIRDNGIGMASGLASGGAAGDAPARCGLAGIADRVAAVGGSFAIDSAPGEGTVLSLSIPLAR